MTEIAPDTSERANPTTPHDDRQQAQSASRDRYADLYQFAPVGSVILNADGVIQQANLTLAGKLSVEPEILSKRPFSDFVTPEGREPFSLWFHALQDGRPAELELQLERRGEARFDALLKGQQADDGHYRISVSDISQLKDAVRAYQTLVDHSLQAMAIIQDGRLAFANPRLSEIVGYSTNELAEHRLAELIEKLIHPDDRKDLRQRLDERPHDRPLAHRGQFRLVASSGEVRWIETLIGPIQYRGRPALQVVALDVSERVTADRALRQSQAFLASIYENTGLAIYLIDVTEDGDFRYAGGNPAWERASGRLSEEIVGRRPEDLEPPQNREAIIRARQQYTRVLETRQTVEYEQYASVNGRDTWWLIRVEPLFDDDDQIYRLIATAVPITERKLAEQALRASEKRYRSLVQTSPDAVLYTAQDTTIRLANDAAAALFGVAAAADLAGQTALAFVAPQDMDAVMGQLAEVVEEGVCRDKEVSLRRQDGTRFPAELSATVIEEGGDHAHAFLVVIRDISERKRMAQLALRTERLAAMGQLATTLAHEIRNPLQAVHTTIELMLDGTIRPNEYEEYFAYCGAEMRRLMEMTEHMLGLAAPRQKTQGHIALDELLQRTVTLIEPQLHRRKIVLEKRLPDALPAVRGSGDEMAQVLLNLFLNAIEAVPENGRIGLTVVHDDKWLNIAVISYGVSIAPDHMPHIFEPFFTTKPEGSGLGLSISQQIVEQSGGNLTADNLADGRGVVFTVQLPPVQQAESSSAALGK